MYITVLINNYSNNPNFLIRTCIIIATNLKLINKIIPRFPVRINNSNRLISLKKLLKLELSSLLNILKLTIIVRHVKIV